MFKKIYNFKCKNMSWGNLYLSPLIRLFKHLFKVQTFWWFFLFFMVQFFQLHFLVIENYLLSLCDVVNMSVLDAHGNGWFLIYIPFLFNVYLQDSLLWCKNLIVVDNSRSILNLLALFLIETPWSSNICIFC